MSKIQELLLSNDSAEEELEALRGFLEKYQGQAIEEEHSEL